MTIRGKQRPPLASQSIAKAFWVILAHTHTPRRGDTHIDSKRTPLRGILTTYTHTGSHTEMKAALHLFHRSGRY